jgi:hypothetical protein
MTTTIPVETIAAALDQISQALTEAPGRHPHDTTVAARLARLTWCLTTGQDTSSVLQLLWQYGIQSDEALLIAQALRGLCLRLAANMARKQS